MPLRELLTVLCGEGNMNSLGTLVSCTSPFQFKYVTVTLSGDLSLQRIRSKSVVLNPGRTGKSHEKLQKCLGPSLDHLSQNL